MEMAVWSICARLDFAGTDSVASPRFRPLTVFKNNAAGGLGVGIVCDRKSECGRWLQHRKTGRPFPASELNTVAIPVSSPDPPNHPNTTLCNDRSRAIESCVAGTPPPPISFLGAPYQITAEFLQLECLQSKPAAVNAVEVTEPVQRNTVHVEGTAAR